MMYVVRRGYSYTDTQGRGQVYREGEAVNCVIDETQRWKLGEVVPKTKLNIETKGVQNATQTKEAKTQKELEEDEMDRGEET